MLIKPFAPIPDLSRSSSNNIKANLLDRRRIAVSPKGRARIEEIHIDSNKKTITKICSLGNFENYKYSVGNRIQIDNSVLIVSDLLSGETIDYKVKFQIPNNNDSKTYQTLSGNYMFLDETNSVYVLKDTDRVYPSKYVDEFIHDSTFNPEYITLGIWSSEEAVQMSYVDFIGLLDSFFTQWGLGYPFDSTVVIDTKTKNFTPTFKYCKELIDEDTALAIFATYAKEISKLIDMISYISELEGRHFRIKVFTNAYMSTISVTDMDYNEMSFNINSSHCDYTRSLINNRMASSKYLISEAAGIVLTNKLFNNITSDIIDSVDYVDTFQIF